MIDVGSVVVCIDDNWSLTPFKNQLGLILPVKGGVYTVRGIYPAGCFTNRTSIWLHEIRNQRHQFLDGFLEPSWWIDRFRPAKPTSIESLEALAVEITNRTPAIEREKVRHGE